MLIRNGFQSLGTQHMTTSATHFSRTLRAIAAGAGLALLAACGATEPPPTAQSIAGLTPSGNVTIMEMVVAGMTGGNGTLSFQGRTYPFRIIGGIVGPGGASKTQAMGEVYNLTDISQFEGLYSESTGKAGLEQSGRAQLWMRNKNGVIMHLAGTTEGMVLSLGRDEVMVKFGN